MTSKVHNHVQVLTLVGSSLLLLTRSSATIRGDRGINGRTRMDGPTEGPPIPRSLRLFGRSLFEIDDLVP